MAKGNHTKILTKMLAKWSTDASPEEIEEAVDAIEDITTEETVSEKAPAEEMRDDSSELIDAIMERLENIEEKLREVEEKMAGADEEPEEDPLAKLEQDLDEIKEQEKVVEEEDEDDLIAPDEDPEEPESKFVDPEIINEEDGDEEVMEEEEEEARMSDKRACDAARAAIKIVKPLIAALPKEQRKRASDRAVAQIRKMSGMSEKPSKNNYVALKRARKAADRMSDADIGKAIMEKRNPQYKK